MDGNEIRQQLAVAFTGETRSAILEAIGAAYSDAQNRWDESVGSNGSTFGTDVYHFACHRLAQRVSRLGPGAAVDHRFRAFRLTVGGYEVGSHRVGDSETESIYSAFPQSEYAGATLASRQLLLFGPPEDDRRGGVVIAHLGNPEQGLCAAYLCLPDSVDKHGRIDHWGHIEELWRRGQDQPGRSGVEVTLPPVEQVEAPVVRRRVGREAP